LCDPIIDESDDRIVNVTSVPETSEVVLPLTRGAGLGIIAGRRRMRLREVSLRAG
jgi:hypothetical protein